ncbi:Lipid A export ATP-binding/permease protein MsbA [Streptococcus mitis]|uniref:Lipid A export ATP-binding/permease protein MsbA n=1 Tax=Streptococcus mitis TaxID=28037 RepID=A0A139PLG4_STRMT|nr:Lipid A export ATP-binding/permease protein MsbA [Streptococcus mitis]
MSLPFVYFLRRKYADSENKNLQVAGLGFAPDDRLDGC